MHRRIAEGEVHPFELGMIHGTPLRKDHLKVSIRKIYEGCDSISVPVPTEEAVILEDALFGFIQWPKNSIALMKVDIRYL